MNVQKKKIILIFLCIASNLYALQFSTLTQVQDYANQYPENSNPDNNNWENLNYSSYHKSIKPNFFRYFFHKIGIKNQQMSLADDVKMLLEKVIADRKKQQLPAEYVRYLPCVSDATVILINDLKGAFHTLVRILTWLHKRKIIDDQFKIIESNVYIIFNGDCLNGSSHILETLYMLLLLMDVNPQSVFYIRGKDEHENHWHNLGLKRELQIRAHHLAQDDEQIPVSDLVSEYFSMLSYAFYISAQDDPSNLIKIIAKNVQLIDLDESFMNNFFTQCHENKIVTYDVSQKIPSEKKFTIRAVMTSPNPEQDNIIKEGIGVLEQEDGAHTWGISSSPVYTRRGKVEFFSEAFAVLTIKESLKQSTIALYNHDPKSLEQEFTKKYEYNLFTGLEKSVTQQGNVFHDFYLGSTMSLSAGRISLASRIKQGALIRIKKENEMGGVNNTLLHLLIENDNYMPYLARENIKHLVNNFDITTFLLPVGTSTLEAYMDYAKQQNLLVLFPPTGALDFRNAANNTIVNYRVSYQDEVTHLLEYLIQEYNVKNFAFFYQDDAYGIDALKAASATLKKYKHRKIVAIPYALQEVSFHDQIIQMNQSHADAIGFFSTALATQEFMRQLGVDYLSNKRLFGLSSLPEESFRSFIKRKGLNMIFSAVVPNPNTSELEIVKEYRTDMKKNYYQTYDTFSLEAYIATSILIDAMKKINGPISKQQIVVQLEAIKNSDFKGLKLNFDPHTRTLSKSLWINDQYKKEWIEHTVVQHGEKDHELHVAKP